MEEGAEGKRSEEKRRDETRRITKKRKEHWRRNEKKSRAGRDKTKRQEKRRREITHNNFDICITFLVISNNPPKQRLVKVICLSRVVFGMH